MTSPHLRAIRAFLFLFSCLLAVGLTAGNASADNHDSETEAETTDPITEFFSNLPETMGSAAETVGDAMGTVGSAVGSAFSAIGLTTDESPAETETDANPDEDEIREMFGNLSENMGDAVQQVFSEYGTPNAVITGEEISGAFLFGLTYGEGELEHPAGSGISHKVYWQGPSLGLDMGTEIMARTYILAYNLNNPNDLFQRFPGVTGKAFFIGGVGVTYLQSEETVLAVIRSGVGVRAGVNTGYLKFRKENTILPF